MLKTRLNMTINQECSTCKFWTGRGIYNSLPGDCKRNAPVAGKHPHTGELAVWPLTHGDDWCGQYEVDDD